MKNNTTKIISDLLLAYEEGVNSTNCDNSGNLVLDIHHLRKGFNGEIILTEGGYNGTD